MTSSSAQTLWLETAFRPASRARGSGRCWMRLALPTSTWTSGNFEIGGLVESSLALNWEAFQTLPRVKVFADMHCVTRWSRLGNLWEGVSLQK